MKLWTDVIDAPCITTYLQRQKMKLWTYVIVYLFYHLQGTSSMDTDNKRLTEEFGLPSVETVFEDIYYMVPNDMLNLTCKANGNPTPRITWLKNGQPFLDTRKVHVTSTGILVIMDTDSSTLGTYQCRASNIHGASVSPVVTVKRAVLGNFPQRQEKVINEDRYQDLALPCTDRPRCEPASVCTFEWKRGEGDKLPSENRIFVDNDGTLHFLYLEQSDDQSYACGVWNGLLNLHVRSPQKTVLFVRSGDTLPSDYPPALLYRKNVVGEMSQSCRLQCVFSGHPLPNILWQDNNGEEINESEVYSLHDNGQTLVISSLKDTHEGVYTCIGHQEQTGARAEGEVHLNVTGPPMFEAGTMADQVMRVGLDAQYSCLSRSLPNEILPEIPEWYQNGRKISTYGPDQKFSRNGTMLMVNNLQKNDTSCIQCVVENSVGRSLREARLVVIDPITVTKGLQESVEITPNIPVTVGVAAVTDPRLSLTYNWSVLDHGTWTNLSNGVMISDDHQNVTFTPNPRNIQEMAGVYRVVIQHAFDSVILEINVSSNVPSTTTSATTTAATEIPTTTPTPTPTTTTTPTPTTTTAATTTITTTTATTTTEIADVTTMMMSYIYPSRTSEPATRPPTHSLEEELDNTPMVVAVVVIAVVILIVLALIIAVLFRRNMRQGTLDIDVPTVKFEPEANGSVNADKNPLCDQ
ncbi:protogenin A-like [Pecten maximus]|uniref:protogenin A-like n=1 Tax=Pecten maximus TaxID=6579 RepID=UPI001458784A|nr:protogenin A-like [Pecten maximus]